MTDNSAVKYDIDADGIVTLTLDDPNQSANTMNEAYTASMKVAVDRLYDEADSVTGVVVTSAKKTFFAGGDLKGMITATRADAPQIFETVEAVKATLRRLEQSNIELSAAKEPCAGSRRSRSRSWPRSTAPRSAAASRSRWPPTTGSRSRAATRSACPRSPSACCPAAAASPAPSACSAS